MVIPHRRNRVTITESWLRVLSLGAIFFLFSLIVAPVLIADEVDDILLKVDEAIDDESYTRAITLLEEGKKSFPDDYRFPRQAGRLYMDRELYHLALGEFKAAESLNPSSGEVLYDMAGTYGYLGENDEAVSVLERLFLLDDPELKDDVIDDLSWMYFKTYRMNDGINLIETALEGGFNRNWAHTLGTLYAGLYNIDKSRYWYMQSIEDALNNGDEYFASVAYYNLSLLDFSFYLFDEAREEALRSLELSPRAGGYMIIGELDFLAWNLNDAVDSYRTAESMDITPLSSVDLASFYQRIGYLDEAIHFIEEIQNESDDSWMYRYGVNRMRFAMDLHLILSDSWKGKARVEALSPRVGLFHRLESLIRRIVWRFKAMYHDRLHRSLTSRYAAELREEGNELDAAWNAAVTTGGYRRISLAYLEEARLIETLLTPRAIPWYEFEMGREAGDADLLMDALNDFSEEEGDPYERTLRELAGRNQRILSELYMMNSGGLRQYGLSLPLTLNVSGTHSRKITRRLRMLLRRSGYQVLTPSADGVKASVLTVSMDDFDNIKWYISDPEGSTRGSRVSDDGISMRSLAAVLAAMLDQFYFTPLGDLHGETEK